MPPRGVAPSLDELEAGDAGFGFGFELSPIGQFAFGGDEEVLAHAFVVTITDRSHGRPDAHFLAAQTKLHRRVLGPLVGVMDHVAELALRDRQVHCVEHQLRSLLRSHRPADHAAAEGAQDDGEIQKARSRRRIGDVSHSKHVRRVCVEVPARKIGGWGDTRIALSRHDEPAATDAPQLVGFHQTHRACARPRHHLQQTQRESGWVGGRGSPQVLFEAS